MTHARLMPTLTFAAAGITASGLALTSAPAQADTAHQTVARAHAPGHRNDPAQLSPSQLARVRLRQSRLAAQHRSAPAFAKAGSKTFTVNTTEDSPLANPVDTTCVDASTGSCSLRAAVGAADNLLVAVKIVLGQHTYTLTTASTLAVTNSEGISIVGRGAGKTAIEGDGSGIFDVTVAGSDIPSGELFLTSLKLEHGSATQGGAAYLTDVSGSTLVLDHVIATHNTASTTGGAIYGVGANGIFISHSTFTHNQAPEGGAIFAISGDIEIADSTFTANSSPVGGNGSGGAIYTGAGVLDVTGGSLSGNTAGDATDKGQGGAIYDIAGQTTLTGVHVDGNTAADDGSGGAFYGFQDALQVDHGTMSHNHARGGTSSGGAVYAVASSVGLHGLTMTRNRSGGRIEGFGGGAVYAYADNNVSQLVVDGHTTITGSDSSALYLEANQGGIDASITDSTLHGNVSTSNNGYLGAGCGGAVCADSFDLGAVNLELQNDHLARNASVGAFGAGAVTATAETDSPVSVVLRHDTFSKNHTGAEGHGGAVGVYSQTVGSPVSLRMSANHFIANRAGSQGSAGYGGALSAYFAATVIDRGSVFSHNKAIGSGADGGAVFDYAPVGSSRFTRSTFTRNSVGMNNPGNVGYGGAFYADASSGSAFDRVTMSGNEAASNGGALFGDNGAEQLRVTASTISGNTAGTSAQQGYGGGIFADASVTTVENSTLTGNRVTSVRGQPGQGGAILYAGSRLGLRYSTVSGNVAKQGAGLFGETYATVVGSIVSRNRTTTHGPENDCRFDVRKEVPVSDGGNVLGQRSCTKAMQSSDQVSEKLHLGRLRNNGGPTRTMAISAKSPAVGRATYLVPSADQRGRRRPAHHADAGAYEVSLPKKVRR